MILPINLLTVALIDDHSENALTGIKVNWFAPARLNEHESGFHLAKISHHTPPERGLKRFKFLEIPTSENPGRTFERFGSDPLGAFVFCCNGRDDWWRWPGVHSELDRLQKYVGRDIDIDSGASLVTGNVQMLNIFLAVWCKQKSTCAVICQRSDYPKFPGESYLRIGLTDGVRFSHTPPPVLVKNIDECI